MHRKKQPSSHKYFAKNRLILGFIGLAASSIIGSAGIAAAAQPTASIDPPTAQQACMNWRAEHFKNFGQCVSAFEHSHHGHGYGGNGNGNSVSTTTNINVNGDGNVITVVINYFFG